MLACSSAFPQTCKCIHSTIKSFSPFAHAHYILGRHPREWPYFHDIALYVSWLITSALRYPITTLAVLKALYSIILRSHSSLKGKYRIEPPKRLFRSLGESDATRDVNSDPLPILRFLWGKGTDFPVPQLVLLGPYPLECAVQAEFIPLVEFLLHHGAHRGWPDYSTVKVAIGKKNLKLVKMIIEDEDLSVIRRGGISVKHFLLDAAIECDARDIVKYLMEHMGAFHYLRT